MAPPTVARRAGPDAAAPPPLPRRAGACRAERPPAPPPPPPIAPPAGRRKPRGALRHPLGGLGRRPCARARRHLPGQILDRGGPDRPRHAHLPRRAVCRGAGRRRRMGAAARAGIRPAGLPIANIPAILTAAGTTVAYATVYAAYGLYGFLSPPIAFVLLGAVALATLAAALLHGPALAGLGLVGAYVTPLLVASATPNYWALYLYLAVVTAAAFALARARLWRWLALTAIAFGFLWVLPGARERARCAQRRGLPRGRGLRAGRGADRRRVPVRAGGEPGRIDAVSSIGLAAYLTAAALLVVDARHDTLTLFAFSALVVAATIAVAWRAEAATAAVPAAAVLAALVIVHWVVARAVRAPGRARRPGRRRRAGAAKRARRLASRARRRLRRTVRRRGLSRARPLRARDRADPVGGIGGVRADRDPDRALLPHRRLRALDPVRRHRARCSPRSSRPRPRRWASASRGPGLAAAAALFATGSIAALALALTFALEKGWLTVGLALMVPGIAYVSDKRPLPALRWLAAIIGLVVLARIGWEPRIVGATSARRRSSTGCSTATACRRSRSGSPAICCGGAPTTCRRAWRIRSRSCSRCCWRCWRSATTSTTATSTATAGLTEVALQVSVWLAMAIGLERVRGRTDSIVHDIGALVIAALALGGDRVRACDQPEPDGHRRAGRRARSST